MHFIYDNLTATIIASTVTLILINMQIQASKKNISKTSRYVVKQQAQTFASWMEKDLARIGQNMNPEDETPIEEPQYTTIGDGVRHTTKFTFYRNKIDDDNGGEDDNLTRVTTRYRVKKVEDEPRNQYQLIRQTKTQGGGGWSDDDGRSSPTLGYFQLDLLDRNAQRVTSPVSNFGDVEMIRVRFSAYPPFQNEETVLSNTHIGSFTLVRQDDGSFTTP